MTDTDPPKSRRQTHAGKIDHTKTRLYAYLDLITKVISSIALVLLGVAGWLLQARSENSREAAERLERQERRYLPMLRSLSELEIVLEHAIDVLRDKAGAGPSGERLNNLATQLRYVAYSVFAPDGDPLVSLTQPRGGIDETQVTMPLRATALMYAELLRILASSSGSAELRLEPPPRRVPDGAYFVWFGNFAYRIPREELPAWKARFGSEPFGFSSVVELASRISDLHNAVTETIHDTLRAHVDLGDRYLGIRSEILKDRLLLNRTEGAPAAQPHQ
jgi:hypothetical protein